MALIALFMLAVCEAAQTTGTVDTGLDPGKITWWKGNWFHASITLSENHAKSGLTLSFHFRPSTTLTNAIIEVEFPSGVSHASLQNNIYSGTQTVTAATDETFAITGVTIDTAGQYGPFGIQTRATTNGQIIDMNKVFGTIYVYQSVADSNTLTVSSNTATTSASINTKDNLSFIFTMNTDIWKHDVFVITPSTYYTPDSVVTCVSGDVTDNANLALGPNGSHTLPCEVSGSDIVVYGLSEDILVDNSIKLKIDVSSFTLPKATYTSGYSWSVSVYRFGTTTLLGRFVSSNAPITLETGTLTVSEWTSQRSYPTLDLVTNLEMFTKVVFTTANELPASGTIVVEFSGVDIASPVWYYEESNIPGAASVSGQCVFTPYVAGSSCVVNSATQLTITVGAVNSGGTLFTVTTLTQFLASPQVARITSYNSAGVSIDKSSLNPLSMTMQSGADYSLLQVFEVEGNLDNSLDNTAGRWKGGNQDDRFLFYKFRPSAAWSALSAGNGATIDIYCPLGNSGIDFFNIQIDSSATWQEKTDSVDTTAYDLTSGAVAVSPTVTYAEGRITINPSAVAQDAYYALVISGNNGAGTNYVMLPIISSGLSTFYECYTRISNVQNSGTTSQTTTYHIGAARLTVVAHDPSDFDLGPICLQGLAGIPYIFTFTGEMIELSFSQQPYELSLQIDGIDLNLVTSSIPVYSEEESTIAATFAFATNSVVTVTGFSSTLAVGDSMSIYVPNGATFTGTINYLVQLKYTESVYGSTHVMFSKSSSFTRTTTGNSISTSDDGDIYTPSTQSSFDFSLSSEADSDNNFLGVIAPTGTYLAGASLSVGVANPSKMIILTSSDPAFTANVIIGLESATFRVDDTTVNMALNAVDTPQSASTVSFSFFEARQSGSTGLPDRLSCISYSTSDVVYNVEAPSLSQITVQVSSCKRRGPTSVNTSMTVNLQLSHPVPVGGLVSVTVHSSWTPSSYVSCSSSTGDACVFSSYTATVTLGTALNSDSTVMITIEGLLAPSSGNAGDSITLLASARTSESGLSIEYSSSVAITCSLELPDSVGTVTVTNKAFPNAAGLNGVDLYLSLESSISFPVNSIIEISLGFTSWLFYGSNVSIKDSCWSSLAYKECQISSGLVEIQTNVDYSTGSIIELYFDKALNLPSSPGNTALGISVTVHWSGVTISQTSTSSVFTTNNAPLGSISPVSLQSNVTNSAEASTYSFQFSSDQAIESSHELWILFPSSYDPYVGEAVEKMPMCTPNSYYIDCSSSELGAIECTVDHWTVVIKSMTAQTAGTSITIQINHVRNPVETTATSEFQMFQIDSSEQVIAYTYSFGTVSISSLPSMLTLKSVTSSSDSLRDSANYDVEFYYQASIDSNDMFSIEFPSQYNIGVARGTANMTCASIYYDESASNANKTAENTWSAQTSCIVSGNSVDFYVLDTDSSKSFRDTDKININITAMPNPEWGYSRTNEALLYDTQSTAVFGELTYWTERFTVFLYDEISKAYTAKSYPNINSAYLGFNNDNKDTFLVNGYDPVTDTGRIQVYPGSQTLTLPIKLNWPLISEDLTLSPSANDYTDDSGGLVIQSSFYNFKFFQWVDEISFRVGAKTTMNAGVYYIDWNITENFEDGNTVNNYAPPIRTLVEVCAPPAALYEFTVAEIPTQYINYQSIPIKVTAERPPATGVTVSLDFSTDTPTGITVNPTGLNFEPNTDELYFRIEVGGSFTGSSATLTFEVSGTDANAYKSMSSIVLQVSSLSNPPNPSSVTVNVGTVTASSATINIIPTQTGVMYWWLGCKGATGYGNFTELKSAAPDLISNPTALSDVLKNSYQNTATDPVTNTDGGIVDFLKRVFAEHCATVWVNSEVVYLGVASNIVVDWLYADTTYTFTAYLDNLLSSDAPSSSTREFTTQSMPIIYSLELEIQEDLAETREEEVRQITANRVGVNPLWLYGYTYRQTSRILRDSKRLQTVSSTYFKWNVLFDRKSIDYKPSDVVARTAELEIAKEDLVSNSIASGTNKVFYYSAVVTSSTSTSWVNNPELNSTSTSTAQFKYKILSDGIVCVACSKQETSSTSKEQVYVGLTGTSQLADGHECLETTEGSEGEINVNGLSSGTMYYCYFTVCSLYPLWPSCLNEGILKMVSFNTTENVGTESVSFAHWLGFSVVVLELIF